MPQIYYPITVPPPPQQQQVNPLDTALQVMQSIQDRKMMQEDRAMKRRLYENQMLHEQSLMQKQQADIAKEKTDQEFQSQIQGKIKKGFQDRYIARKSALKPGESISDDEMKGYVYSSIIENLPEAAGHPRHFEELTQTAAKFAPPKSQFQTRTLSDGTTIVTEIKPDGSSEQTVHESPEAYAKYVERKLNIQANRPIAVGKNSALFAPSYDEAGNLVGGKIVRGPVSGGGSGGGSKAPKGSKPMTYSQWFNARKGVLAKIAQIDKDVSKLETKATLGPSPGVEWEPGQVRKLREEKESLLRSRKTYEDELAWVNEHPVDANAQTTPAPSPEPKIPAPKSKETPTPKKGIGPKAQALIDALSK